MTKRPFLALAVAMTAATLVLLYGGREGTANSTREIIAQEETGTRFVSGRVVERTDDAVVLDSATGRTTLHFSEGAMVWKEMDGPTEQVEVGDWVDASATVAGDGRLTASDGDVWVNIGRREGVIESVSADGLVLANGGHSEAIEFSETLEVISLSQRGPAADGVSALESGMQIGAVGLRTEAGFRATRIWFE